MQLTRRTQGRFWLGMIACAVAGIVLATEAQAQQPSRDRRVRLVIPDGMPAFDPAVRERHEQAVVPRALVFPTGPGEEGVSVVLLNPRHADVGTLATALSLLARALDAERTEIVVVTSPEQSNRRIPAVTKATRDLAILKASPQVDVPKLRSMGQVIEVSVDLEAWRKGGGE